MSPLFSHLLIPFLLSMFLAVNMGGSGTAPSFAAAYGAGLIRRDLIAGVFGLCVFLGAILAGRQVSMTLGQGILEAGHFTYVLTSVVLLSIGLSLLIANLLGIPQSTSQATVLAIVGAATYRGGLNVEKLFLEIIPTWFILPVAAFALMYLIARLVFPLVRWGLTRLDFGHLSGHPVLRAMVLLSSAYVAFSIGANNVANAAGPIASMTVEELGLPADGDSFLLVAILSVLLIAPCFGIGSSLFGYKVARSTGKDIVSVGPFSACVIAFLTASLLLSASLFRGIPTSLVQLNTAAFLAVSISRHGWRDTFAKPRVRAFFLVWALAPLLAFGLTIGLLALCDYAGLTVGG